MDERIKRLRELHAAASQGPTDETRSALARLAELIPVLAPMVGMWDQGTLYRARIVREAVCKAAEEIKE